MKTPTETQAVAFTICLFIWHWGLLLLGLLPYPYPRLPLLYAALAIDAVGIMTWVYFFHKWLRKQ